MGKIDVEAASREAIIRAHSGYALPLGFVGVALVWIVLGLMSIGACKTPEAIIVMRSSEPCLFTPPPVPKKVEYPACDAGVACLDGPNADALGDNLAASQRWERNAWIRCGAFDAGMADARR